MRHYYTCATRQENKAICSVLSVRDVLDRLVEKITLSDGGAHVDYRVKDEQIAFLQPDPSGPPNGSCRQWSIEIRDEGVRRPKCRAEAAL